MYILLSLSTYLILKGYMETLLTNFRLHDMLASTHYTPSLHRMAGKSGMKFDLVAWHNYFD